MKKRIISFITAAVTLLSMVVFSVSAYADVAVKTGTYLITYKNGSNLYSSPAFSTDFLTTVPDNTYITVIKTQGNFGYTVFDAIYGWIDLSYGASYIDSKPAIIESGKTEGAKGIAITRLPDKLVYVEGEEKADISGLEVSLVFDDEQSSKMPVSGYRVSFPTLDIYGKKTVKIYYGGFSTEFNISVVKVPVTGISLTLPKKTTYIEGEAISFDGLSVSAYFSDGRDNGNGVLLDRTEYTVSGVTEGDSKLAPGTYSVNVTYKYPEISAVFHIYVSKKRVTSLKLVKAPSDLSVYKGQSFNNSDFLLLASYDNGTSENISDFDIEYDNMTVGSHTARIYYMDKYVAFDYEVFEVYETGIALGDTTAVGSYVGNNIDFSELHVYLVFNSGDKREISDYSLDYDIDIETEGKYEVTVSYGDHSQTFMYTVAKKQEIKIGDADLNGRITPADARVALRAAVRLEILSEEAVLAADVDGDGNITPSDARKILRVSAGLEAFT